MSCSLVKCDAELDAGVRPAGAGRLETPPPAGREHGAQGLRGAGGGGEGGCTGYWVQLGVQSLVQIGVLCTVDS